MKILYISSDPGISTSLATGASTHIVSVVKALRKLGAQVECLIAGDNNSSHRRLNKTSFMRRFFPLTLRTVKRDISFLMHDNFWTAKIIQIATSFKPDIIYERTAFLHLSGIRAAKKLNIPILVEMNSPVSEVNSIDGSLLMPLASYLEKRTFLLAEAVVTVSNAMKNYLVGRGASPEKVYVLHNAADKGTLNSVANYALEKKSDSNIILAHVSSFAHWYRIDILIKALIIAKKSYSQLNLFLIGDGPLRKKFDLLAQRLNISNSIIFMGEKTQSETLEFLAKNVDIAFCTNNSWYGSPTKIFEYGATGKPVIAFWTPAIAEIIEHEKTGLLVSPENPDELASAIVRLIKDPELRFRLAKNWQRKVLNEHTWDLVALKTVDICKKILKDKGD